MKRTRYFQWLDGELTGTVSILDHIEREDGEYYYVFTDGEMCNSEFIAKMTKDPRALIDKAMVEVDSPRNAWTMQKIETKTQKDANGQIVQVPTLDDVIAAGGKSDTAINISTEGRYKWVAPPITPRFFEDLPDPAQYLKEDTVSNVSSSFVRPEPAVPEIPQTSIVFDTVAVAPPAPDNSEPVHKEPVTTAPVRDITDPVGILVKNCKKHSTDVNLTLTINLPSKSTFEFAAAEFDGGDTKFIDFVLDDLKSDLVFDALREALLNAYRSGDSE